MKLIVVALTMGLLLPGVSRAELLTGQIALNSKDGKVIGLKSSGGLVSMTHGQNMRITGVSSIEALLPCDKVEVDFAWKGKSRVINSLALKERGNAETCPVLLAPTIAVAELYRALADKSSTVLDVRRAEEYAVAHFAGAVNIPLGELEARIAEIPKGKPVILYCSTARRATFAAVLLEEKGVEASVVKGTFAVKDGKPQIVEK